MDIPKKLLAKSDALYRATGANLPYGDPRPSHGALMEGYFWRVTDAASGRALVVLCGVNRHPDGPWATVAIATHPGAKVRDAALDDAYAATDSFDVRVGTAVRANAEEVSFDLGDAAARFSIRDVAAWPLALGGGGLFSVVPFLSQYWHPHLLGGSATGYAVMDGERWEFDGAKVYAEKNWGRGFPDRWWWGQSHDFGGDDVSVAFGGGDLHFQQRRLSVGGVVVRIGARVLRFTPPSAWVTCRLGNDTWSVRARRPGYEVLIEGYGAGAQPHILPVPVPAERRNIPTDLEHLGAHMEVTLRRGTDVVYRGTSTLAGLETGTTDTLPDMTPHR